MSPRLQLTPVGPLSGRTMRDVSPPVAPGHDDQALLEALALPLAAGEPPRPDHCEALADRLMLAGAGAAAARWRSWALLPPAPSQLLAALGEATFVLCEPAGEQHGAWAPLIAALDQNPTPQALDALVVSALQAKAVLPPLDVVEAVVGRLEQAGAPRAALRLLEVMWLEQRQLGVNAPALCNRMARLWRQLGDLYQAELRFRLSLEQLPEQQLVWFQLAKLLLDQREPERALSCAEQGLHCYPGHDWGLKLRVHALRAMGGWASLRLLQQQGLWPADADLGAALSRELDRADERNRRLQRWAGRVGPVGGQDLQSLAGELGAKGGAVVVLQGRRAQPVTWLARQGVWPADRRVQPVASRDPWQVREALMAAGCVVAEELPLTEVRLGPRPALVVLERPWQGALPLELGPWMRDPEVAWLAPAGWLQPAAHQLRWCEAGWRLWVGTSEAGQG